MTHLLTRRWLLRRAAAAAAAAAMRPVAAGDDEVDKALPPIRAITRGPKHHWFGYYDKLQFDPACRYVLGMEAAFEHRSPRPDDAIKVGMVDLRDGDRWTELGESRAWCWQQGCMLQFLPGSKTEVIYNDRQGNRFVCHVLDVKTGLKRTIGRPIYTISPDGRTAVAPDFARIQSTRKGYGYAGVADPCADRNAPDDSGIVRVDLKTGRSKLLLSLARIAALGEMPAGTGAAKQWVNHLLFNPDGSRFVFLHRCRAGGGMYTRMITAGPDGSEPYVLDGSGHTSHFIWRGPEHVLAWTHPPGKRPGFWLLRDRTGEVEQVGKGVMAENGHCSYLSGGQWVLNDTYPRGRRRLQHVYLYHAPTGRQVALGRFHSPPQYAGEWRCDTHPRFSPDGRMVVIDSPHGGSGRQMYLIDVGGITG